MSSSSSKQVLVLGGGIAGAICGRAMFDPAVLNKKDQALFDRALAMAKLYFYNLNNGGGDEYMQEEVTGGGYKGYAKNQNLPVSAY